MKKKWYKKECNGCRSYCPECRQGMCSIYPYIKQKSISNGEKINTS